MTDEVTQKVEVRFAGPPPVKQIERASGVSDVRVDGSVVSCLVCGSFQSFLEALRGYEVVSLTSTAHRGPGRGTGRTAIDLTATDTGVSEPSPEEGNR
jgi:hypothetical protein